MRWENALVIDAPVEAVWALTLDVERWPDTTPTVTRVVRLDDGPLRVGSRARIKQPAQSEAVWTVTRLTEHREFTWQTRRLGLTMTGSHLLEPVGDGCRNTLSVEVAGLAAGVFGLLFGALIRRSITLENAGFRQAATSVEKGRS
ncbi:SRPBCC family protein [Catellatospora sp. KI3]|uniref:SRPBCC family protein n=1 Tax=Catellatospora sp. KI3 TaxID=3041620 RepID=UPI002482C883|nr:SRPBCC family protein [Catellatospora sp. KI3]MDI1462575.1 SRPBCC family protein [Catellatospora sp. KI3]